MALTLTIQVLSAMRLQQYRNALGLRVYSTLGWWACPRMIRHLIVYGAVLAVVASPVTMLAGWIKWFRGPHQPGVFPKLSFIGMSLTSATVFGLLAFAIYAVIFGVRFSVHYELLVSIYRFFALLCMLGFLFGLVGVWRRSPLRWLAPACAFCTACIWLIGALMIDPI
jgi:hypothetical protein